MRGQFLPFERVLRRDRGIQTPRQKIRRGGRSGLAGDFLRRELHERRQRHFRRRFSAQRQQGQRGGTVSDRSRVAPQKIGEKVCTGISISKTRAARTATNVCANAPSRRSRS